MKSSNPLKAIKEKCLNDCCAGMRDEVVNCLCTKCPLYEFRLGKNPYRKPMSEEKREKMRERAKLYGFKKKSECSKSSIE